MFNRPLNRWVMLAAHVVINFVLGGVYAFSFFKGPLMAEFHWDPALLALAFSLNMGIIPIPMIIGGKMIDQGHGKAAIIIGGILFSLGFILSGFVHTLPMLLLTYGLLAGFGSGLAFTGNLNNVMKFFPDRKALASGIVLAGVGFGTLLCTELAKFFLAQMSITNSLLWLGIVYLGVLFVTQFFIRSAPAKGSGGIPASPMDQDWRGMLQTVRFWILFIILAVGCFAGVVINSASVQIGTEQFGLASGALVVSLVSIFNSIGRVVWGAVADRLGNYRTLTVVYLSMAALMVLLTLGSGAAAFYIGAVGIGFVYAGVLTIFPSLTSQNFGMRNQGMNYGFMYAGFGLGSVISPYVTSAIGAGGSYSPVFMLAIFLLVGGVVMIQVMQRMGQRAINQAKGAEAH